VVFTPAIWFITDKVVEPRLGKWGGEADADMKAELERSEVTPREKRGLRWAGLAALAIVGLYTALTMIPGYSPLIDAEAEGTAQLQPFYGALIAGFFLLFVTCGIAFGVAAGTIKKSDDVTAMMREGIVTLAPYIVFVFFAAHFVAMFNWSRLGPIIAINGAEALQTLSLPAPFLLVSVLLLSSSLDLFIGSASAKWSALAPVVVPMFMLLGISPEMTTAAYRMGDSYTNIMTPLMSYFPLILAFARRWDKSFGVGSLLALMLPCALTFRVLGISMVVMGVFMDLPLLRGDEVPHAPWLAVAAHPWPGSVAVYGSAEAAGGFDLTLMLQRRALIGRTLTPLGRASPGLIDRGEPLRLRMLRDPLRSVNERALLSGANAMAIGDGSLTRWEIIQFANAELVAPDTWQISRRLRGQAGTDAIMPDVWPAGSLVVLLDGGPRQVDLPPSTRGQERFWRVGPALRAPDDASYRSRTTVAPGIGLRPYAPCHLRKQGNDITWIRRSRLEGDGWDGADVPLGEESERYLLRLIQAGQIVAETQTQTPSWTIPAAVRDQLQPGHVTIEVAQLSQTFGRGPFARRDFNAQ